MSDDDTYDAQCFEQEQNERREREEAALAHARKVRTEFHASNAEFAREMDELRHRTQPLRTLT